MFITSKPHSPVRLIRGDLVPKNVNYATKIPYALPLLESAPGLPGKLKPPHPARERKSEEVVQEARAAVALVLVY